MDQLDYGFTNIDRDKEVSFALQILKLCLIALLNKVLCNSFIIHGAATYYAPWDVPTAPAVANLRLSELSDFLASSQSGKSSPNRSFRILHCFFSSSSSIASASLRSIVSSLFLN